MIELIKKEIKLLEKELRELKKGKYMSFNARKGKKKVKVRFKLKPKNRFLEGELSAYKKLLAVIDMTGEQK